MHNNVVWRDDNRQRVAGASGVSGVRRFPMSKLPQFSLGLPSLLAQWTAEQQASITAAVIWITVVAILAVVGYYVVRKLRDGEDNRQPQASELMSNFRELHSQGKLDEQEYRTIKTLLSARLQDELKDTGERG